MDHRIRRGLTIRLAGAPEQVVGVATSVTSVGLMGADYPGLRAEILVEIGQQVKAGEPVFRDRKRPEILVTAPLGGTVSQINIGPRRRLSSLIITASDTGEKQFATTPPKDREAARSFLLESGLWPLIRERPFGRIPDPRRIPDAVFITAMDTEPLAAEPRAVLAGTSEALRLGVGVLRHLTEGPVFFCQGEGQSLIPEEGPIRVERFHGCHPAGLAGTHIDRLFPVNRARRVWQINYQDALALGQTLQTGFLAAQRVVSLAGPGVARPRLLRVTSGAQLDALVAWELNEGAWRVLSGSPLSGVECGYLRRRHTQVSVMPRPSTPSARWGWWPTAAASPRTAPVIPSRAVDDALGPGLPAMALIRALGCGDIESAERLGCRGLLEEDMALLSYAAGGVDLAAQLRRTLDALEAAA